MNPVSIEIHLQPGFPIANLISPHHRILVAEGPGGGRIIRLADGEVPADRDFELGWRSAAADASVGLFRERLGTRDYLMAMLTPPVDDRRAPVPPREMIFVIDNSGSMAGESMEQARQSLLHALGTLTPADRFNVIRFDDSMTQLFEVPVAATPDQVDLALRYAESLEAEGGTEMLPALRAALVDPTPADGRVRQLIFMTDGAISNEAEMLEAIGASRGRSRVFMIGIGSAPNSLLMSRMAEVGRGSYVHIGDTAEVNARMTELLDRLTRPAVTELEVRIVGADAEITPRQLPDLYAGEPLVVLARGDALGGTLEVSGRIGGRAWRRSVPLSEAVEGAGVARLWARRRIAETEVAATLGTITEEEAADTVVRLGLEFSLVTSETSLVAVDRTPARPRGARLTEEELPLNLPHGWDFDALFGGETADGAAPDVLAAEEAEPLDLPQTGTEAATLMRGGAILLLIALAGLAVLRRRKPGMRMTTLRGRRALARLLFLLLAACGLILIGQGAIIPAKAWAAQILLERAFAESRATGRPARPWPWADATPVARIRVERLGVDEIVLSGGSGEAMAFGPTLLPGGGRLGERGTAVFAAHRDTHFRFLGDGAAGRPDPRRGGERPHHALSRRGGTRRALRRVRHRSPRPDAVDRFGHLLADRRQRPRAVALCGSGAASLIFERGGHVAYPMLASRIQRRSFMRSTTMCVTSDAK